MFEARGRASERTKSPEEGLATRLSGRITYEAVAKEEKEKLEEMERERKKRMKASYDLQVNKENV